MDQTFLHSLHRLDRAIAMAAAAPPKNVELAADRVWAQIKNQRVTLQMMKGHSAFVTSPWNLFVITFLC
jgi:hypothetical protein